MDNSLKYHAYTEDEVKSLRSSLLESGRYRNKGGNSLTHANPFYEVRFDSRTITLVCEQTLLECATAHFNGVLDTHFSLKCFMVH